MQPRDDDELEEAVQENDIQRIIDDDGKECYLLLPRLVSGSLGLWGWFFFAGGVLYFWKDFKQFQGFAWKDRSFENSTGH